MSENGFRKFFWGFLFIMIDIKMQGFDILPDIIGYIFFAAGFSILAASSAYFIKARNFNIPMIILSVFSIYEKPAEGESIQLGQPGLLGVLLLITTYLLGLLVVYNLFMGIKEMAVTQGQLDIYNEAGTIWNQYLLLWIASMLGFILIFVPGLALAYFIGLIIASVILTYYIMQFMRRCEVCL